MRKRTFKTKPWILIVSIFLLLAVTVGGTIAYITARTEPTENEFVPAKVSCEILETFSQNVKSDVRVKNTGNTDAYLRATIIVNWVTESGEAKVLSTSPILGTDYQIEWGKDGWKEGTDGFWYYQDVVSEQKETKKLIVKATTLTDAPEGYRLEIQVLASAIQAKPETVVEEEWKVTVENGVLTPN